MKFTTHKFQKQRSVERNRRAANKKYYLRYKLNEARVDNFLEDILSRVLEWRVVDIYIYRFKSHLAAFETHTHTLHVYQDLWLASRSSSIFLLLGYFLFFVVCFVVFFETWCIFWLFKYVMTFVVFFEFCDAFFFMVFFAFCGAFFDFCRIFRLLWCFKFFSKI